MYNFDIILRMYYDFYASANVVAKGIMFPECLCVHACMHLFVHESETNIVTKISWMLVDII